MKNSTLTIKQALKEVPIKWIIPLLSEKEWEIVKSYKEPAEFISKADDYHVMTFLLFIREAERTLS